MENSPAQVLGSVFKYEKNHEALESARISVHNLQSLRPPPPTGTQCSASGLGDHHLCHMFICKITVFIAGIYIHAFSVGISVHRIASLMA